MATTIDTPRLRLVPVTLAAAMAGPDGRDEIAAACVAWVPAEWPPEHYDADALAFTRAAIEAHPASEFVMRYLVTRDDPTVVGIVGAGAPDANGCVVIGYSVLPAFQRRGFASEALRGVVGLARSDPRVRVIAGDTYPSLEASVRTMQTCGFVFAGARDGGVVRYELAISNET